MSTSGFHRHVAHMCLHTNEQAYPCAHKFHTLEAMTKDTLATPVALQLIERTN